MDFLGMSLNATSNGASRQDGARMHRGLPPVGSGTKRYEAFLLKICQFGAQRKVSSRKAVGQATSHWLTLWG